MILFFLVSPYPLFLEANPAIPLVVLGSPAFFTNILLQKPPCFCWSIIQNCLSKTCSTRFTPRSKRERQPKKIPSQPSRGSPGKPPFLYIPSAGSGANSKKAIFYYIKNCQRKSSHQTQNQPPLGAVGGVKKSVARAGERVGDNRGTKATQIIKTINKDFIPVEKYERDFFLVGKPTQQSRNKTPRAHTKNHEKKDARRSKKRANQFFSAEYGRKFGRVGISLPEVEGRLWTITRFKLGLRRRI